VSSEDEQDYEVDRILDVHTGRNEREFLIKWVGYGTKDSTWEPEKNLNCPDKVAAFMAKLNKLLDVSDKELRIQRKPIQPYQDTSVRYSGVRSSKRGKQKARVTYHGQDE